MHKFPVKWGGSKSPKITDVSEQTESQDIALSKLGKDPSADGLPRSDTSDPILSVLDCRKEKDRELCLKM